MGKPPRAGPGAGSRWGQHGPPVGEETMAMRSSSCDSESTPDPIGVIFPVKGWARNTAGTWVTCRAVAIPLSGRARGKPGIGPPSTLHGDDLDAVAGLERLQGRREGVAVGAVAAEEEMSTWSRPSSATEAERSVLLALEDLQRLGVDG